MAAMALAVSAFAGSAAAQVGTLNPYLNGGQVGRPDAEATQPRRTSTVWRLLGDASRAYAPDNTEAHALYVFCNGGRYHMGYGGFTSGGFIDSAEGYEARSPNGPAFLFDYAGGVVLDVFSSRHRKLATITLTQRRVSGGTVFRATLSDDDVAALRAASYISWDVGAEHREWRGDGSSRALDGIRPMDGRACA
ncbi:hypothetical protein [Brevundimonas sp.]|uniref:hypothetical protein n=1 Tax=Brevundimonas sp. TaxID=1871086 RepID=UPI002E11E88F|nr:hypothetical protein [Brevundimonas sp.]